MTGLGGKLRQQTVILTMLLALGLAFAAGSGLAQSQSKRLGGGKNSGQQSSRVVEKEKKAEPVEAPAAQPAQQGREPEVVQRSAAGPDDRPGANTPMRRGWTGMLGGMAAGLGIAAAVNAMGLSGAVGDLVTGALVVSMLLAMGLLGWQLARHGPSFAFNLVHRGAKPSRSIRSSFSASDYEPATLAPESSVHYLLDHIEQPASGGSAFRWGAPSGFDSDGFLQQAKRQFVVLQQAWDAADDSLLSDLMTDELLANIRLQLQERGDRPNRTDVVTLDAELLGVEIVDEHHVASVEFSGMIREEVSAGATPFREVWSLTKPQDGSSGWLLASVQALH